MSQKLLNLEAVARGCSVKKEFLKACFRYVLSYFYFSLNDSPSKKYEKWFLFHLKSSFRSRDIQTFVFPSSQLFSTVNNCFRVWSKITFKIYDVMNCLNKNLITYCVWYHEKGKKVWHWNLVHWYNKEHFMGKSCRECAPKVSPRPLFNFGKQPKTAIVCKKFFKK